MHIFRDDFLLIQNITIFKLSFKLILYYMLFFICVSFFPLWICEGF